MRDGRERTLIAARLGLDDVQCAAGAPNGSERLRAETRRPKGLGGAGAGGLRPIAARPRLGGARRSAGGSEGAREGRMKEESDGGRK